MPNGDEFKALVLEGALAGCRRIGPARANGAFCELCRHQSPASSGLPGGDKLAHAFRQWLTLDQLSRQAVMPNDAVWTVPFVQQAAKMTRDRAAKLTGVIPPVSKRADIMATTIKGELKGIADATVQRASRALAHGLLTHQRPSKIAREVGAVIDAIGKTRTGQMANYAIMKTFSTVTLEAFRAAGVTHVGTVAEKIKVARGPHGLHRIKDAARKTAQKRHGRTGKFISYVEPPTAAEQATIERGEAAVQALVEVDVLTAGDEDVCPICEDISDDGPYDIDSAEGLIPAHPSCRCVLIPTSDLRFAPVRDE